VFGYEVRDGRPAIAATNEAFEAAFDGAGRGTPVREWLAAEFAVDRARAADLCSSLTGTEAVDARIDPRGSGAAYRIRSARAPDGAAADGVCLLTEGPDGDGVDVERIASVISHDLRNPLDVAKARLRAARETGEDEHFDHLRRAHDRMERIIQDVLTLTRGDSPVDPDPGVDLGTVASDAWTTVDTEGAQLVVDEDLPTAAADADRLRRLFENLFRNSVEHGRPRTDGDRDDPLRVRVGRTGGGFYVADDGVGIPPDERGRVFDIGYSGNDGGGGTGLGLAIVERIAEGHGWTPSVSAGPDGGARFDFEVAAE
jgi:signal transduction histidine kinase